MAIVRELIDCGKSWRVLFLALIYWFCHSLTVVKLWLNFALWPIDKVNELLTDFDGSDCVVTVFFNIVLAILHQDCGVLLPGLGKWNGLLDLNVFRGSDLVGGRCLLNWVIFKLLLNAGSFLECWRVDSYRFVFTWFIKLSTYINISY